MKKQPTDFDIFKEYVRWCENTSPVINVVIQKIMDDTRLDAKQKIHVAIRLGVTFSGEILRDHSN